MECQQNRVNIRVRCSRELGAMITQTIQVIQAQWVTKPPRERPLR